MCVYKCINKSTPYSSWTFCQLLDSIFHYKKEAQFSWFFLFLYLGSTHTLFQHEILYYQLCLYDTFKLYIYLQKSVLFSCVQATTSAAIYGDSHQSASHATASISATVTHPKAQQCHYQAR